MLLILLSFSILWQSVCGFMITVDAHETVCFYDHAHEGDKFTISFEVMEGGFKDVSISISGPNNNLLHQAEMETKGSYTFAASDHGKYTLCFDNERSTLTPKVLMFHFNVMRDIHHYTDLGRREDDVMEKADLQESINSLSSQIVSIKHELEYMRVRYLGHDEVNQSVHFRVVAWMIFGPSLLLLMTLTEVYYLKRFFEVKRVV